MRRVFAVLGAISLVVVACGGDDSADTTTAATAATTTTAAPTTTAPTGPAMSPAEVVFDAQSSDGTSIVVASVTLPSPGFIAVHSNADGGPGPVIGHSELLPAGTSTEVVVTLDEPLAATDLLFPMAHIDVNGDGEYDFMPPDIAIDLPATTADGAIAVVGAEVTIEETSAAPAMSPAEVVFDAQTSDGTSIVVASVTLPSPGFIAVHSNADGGPGPVIGHSELLPAGTSTEVVVTLDEPLAATDLLFPMAHIDVNGDGEYDFMPPDIAIDLPATTADGAIAVVGAEVTIEG